jgi:ketosteroid isomerase-like protein
MPNPREIAAVTTLANDFMIALTNDDEQRVNAFVAKDVDVMSAEGFEVGEDRARSHIKSMSKARTRAETVGMRFVSKTTAIVDLVFDDDDGRGWISEVWSREDGATHSIRAVRSRYASPKRAFETLNNSGQSFKSDVLRDDALEEEKRAIQKQFKRFRAAFNEGDSEEMVALWEKDANAIVAFSFLGGRAQFLEGQAAMGDKADRMSLGAMVSNPADRAARRGGGAVMVSGEPKSIRFLSKTLAVVDGTAEIGNIPAAHGFTPKEMTGVYTDFWSKSSGTWKLTATRPWF